MSSFHHHEKCHWGYLVVEVDDVAVGDVVGAVVVAAAVAVDDDESAVNVLIMVAAVLVTQYYHCCDDCGGWVVVVTHFGVVSMLLGQGLMVVGEGY